MDIDGWEVEGKHETTDADGELAWSVSLRTTITERGLSAPLTRTFTVTYAELREAFETESGDPLPETSEEYGSRENAAIAAVIAAKLAAESP